MGTSWLYLILCKKCKASLAFIWHRKADIAFFVPMMAGCGAALAQKVTPPDLFVPVASSSWVGVSATIGGSANHQPVKFNAGELLVLPNEKEARITLPRLGTLTITHDRTEYHANGDVTWVGYFKDYGTDYRVIITSGVNGSSGRVLSPDGEFSLIPGAGNDWLIDRKQAGFQGVSQSADDAVAQPLTLPTTAASTETPLTAAAVPAGNSSIDLMIVYTAGMVKRYGSGLQTRLNNLVQIANQAYIDSGIAITLNLVYSVEIDYSDTVAISKALNDLTNGAGLFSGIPALRGLYGADLVQLIRPFYYSQSYCGLAWINSANPTANFGYSVAEDGSDVGGKPYYCYDFASVHELGHNMGAAHDRAHANIPGAFSYSYGYGVDGVFATIMAAGYINATPVSKFSSPNLRCGPNSTPCGIADNSPNSADNVQTLNNTRAAVAAFASPLLVTLTASANPINYMGSTTLNWSSANANSCSATTSYGWSGSVPLSGNATVTPTSSSTYTLACVGNGGASLSKSVTVKVTVNPNSLTCLFNWAEINYSTLFAPSGAPMQTWDVYTYRYYSATKAYLGISSTNNDVYYEGHDGNLQDVGALSYWLSKAGCQ